MAFAQKAKLREAKSFCNKLPPDYEQAKLAIDTAIVDDVTKSIAETWYYRGIIYSGFFTDVNLKSKCNSCLFTAYESFLTAEELDKKNEYLLEIESKLIPSVRQHIFEQAVGHFQSGEYDLALNTFEFILKKTPEEMAAIQNAAICAENAGNYPKAIIYYKSLIDKKNADNKTYVSLAKSMLHTNDTSGALGVLINGKKLFPDSADLILTEINIYLAMKRAEEALVAINDAIKKDASNVSLYLVKGSLNESLAKPADKDGNLLPAPKNQKELLALAKEAYGQGLTIDPNHFELNYNMGALIFNEATEMENAANAIANEAQFKLAKEKCKSVYLTAEPFLEKALAASPEDPGTLNSLKLLYFRINETDKYNAVKKKLDSLH